MVSMNEAAAEAYQWLRKRNPDTPVCVLGESIGSGPACFLAGQTIPPDKIILVVPFDSLANAGSAHFPFLPVRWLLRDPWDNVQALAPYKGPVEIYGAEQDTIIPITRARALASRLPASKFMLIHGGHNDWSEQSEVRIE